MIIDPDLLPSIVGPVGDASVLRPGEAFRLCGLSNPGELLISKDHTLVAVQHRDNDSAWLYTFLQPAPDVWNAISFLSPGTRPGDRFARFLVVEEENEYGYTPSFGLLDLLLLDVLVRGPRVEIEHLCKSANDDAEQALQRLVLADLSHSLRMAEPSVAGVLTEQLWLGWQRRNRAA